MKPVYTCNVAVEYPAKDAVCFGYVARLQVPAVTKNWPCRIYHRCSCLSIKNCHRLAHTTVLASLILEVLTVPDFLNWPEKSYRFLVIGVNASPNRTSGIQSMTEAGKWHYSAENQKKALLPYWIINFCADHAKKEPTSAKIHSITKVIYYCCVFGCKTSFLKSTDDTKSHEITFRSNIQTSRARRGPRTAAPFPDLDHETWILFVLHGHLMLWFASEFCKRWEVQ